MSTIEVYSKAYCPYCALAKSTLGNLGADYNEIDVASHQPLFDEMVQRSGRRTVPQIFINGQHIGGSDDLVQARNSGLLTQLLKPCSINN